MNTHSGNIKVIRNSSTANKAVQYHGFENAEEFKKCYVDNDGSLFNIAKDFDARTPVLVRITDSSIQISTPWSIPPGV